MTATDQSQSLNLHRDDHNGSHKLDHVCPNHRHETTLSFEYKEPSKFAFEQQSQGADGLALLAMGKHVRTGGEIRVRPMKERSETKIRVDLDIRASDPKLFKSESLSIAEKGSTLTVKTPKELNDKEPSKHAKESPCLYILATVWISPGTTLETLGIHSEMLSVIFDPGLDYAILRKTEVSAHSASLSIDGVKPPLAMTLYSRETVINVNSASVTGSYPLYDLLTIHTNSGSIDITIDPKVASKDNVKPAVLRLTSNSGSIRATTSTTSVPDRDYRTDISTSDGSMDLALLHGLRTSLRSINGRMTVDLYPYGHNNSRTDIETHSNSGSTDITVHRSISHPTAPLKELFAFYHADSGSMQLWYPAQWQGTVQGTTSSGSINLDWDGLKIVKDEKRGWTKRAIEAVRGDGEAKLFFTESSGSMTLGGESGSGIYIGERRSRKNV